MFRPIPIHSSMPALPSAISAFRQILSDFPNLTPDDNTFSNFTGFFTVSNHQFRISLSADLSHFSADSALLSLLQPCLASLKSRLSTSQTPHIFLLELRDLIERQLLQTSHPPTYLSSLPSASFYERLLSELSNIGWSSVFSLSTNMRVLDLTLVDSSSRSHTVNLTLPVDYPLHPPHCVTALPFPFKPNWTPKSTLTGLLEELRKVVEQYGDFFKAMQDLDDHTYVLEPAVPTWRECYRRIKVNKGCSVRVEINANMPIRGLPECRFLGSEAAISSMRETLNRNMAKWDMSGDVLPRENLENVLGIQFPAKEEKQDELNLDELDGCGICYAYRLEDAVPDVACDRKECGKQYHRACLVGWLTGLATTRESLGMMTGNCVYCEYPITVAVAD